MPKSITFTQYLRPNGRRVAATSQVSDELGTMAEEIVAAGYELEAEVLTTGEVCFAIAKDGEDHDIEICPNGPEVPDAVDRLIRHFHELLRFLPQKKEGEPY